MKKGEVRVITSCISGHCVLPFNKVGKSVAVFEYDDVDEIVTVITDDNKMLDVNADMLSEEPIGNLGHIESADRKASFFLCSRYWDCECKENYIHRKSITLYCPLCDMREDDGMPDSRVDEILYFMNQARHHNNDADCERGNHPIGAI